MSQLPNAAQLAVSHDGKTLYLASEREQGVVQALRIDDNGELSELNQVLSGGGAGLSFAHAERSASAGGELCKRIDRSAAIKADGSPGDATDRHQDQGELCAAKPEAAAEGSFAISDHNGPHAHMIAADPSGKYVFSTDPGLDRIYQYRFDDRTGKLTPNDPPFISASSKGPGRGTFVFTPKMRCG